MGKQGSICLIPIYTLMLRPLKFSAKVVKDWQLFFFLSLASFPKPSPAPRAESFVWMMNWLSLCQKVSVSHTDSRVITEYSYRIEVHSFALKHCVNIPLSSSLYLVWLHFHPGRLKSLLVCHSDPSSFLPLGIFLSLFQAWLWAFSSHFTLHLFVFVMEEATTDYLYQVA